MGEPEFNVSLGGGLYMDSNGDVHRGTFSAVPAYPMPGGGLLPITKESFEKAMTGTTKALQGIVKVLPDPKDPDSIKRFTELGAPDSLINLLGNFGGVAAKFAKVIPIVGAVVVVLEEFVKFFSPSGPSQVELMMIAHFAGVHTHIDALAMEVKLLYVGDRRVEISRALTRLSEYLELTRKYQPSLAELQRRHTEIASQRNDVAGAVERLLLPTTWLFSYNPDTFKNVWRWVGDSLSLMPASAPPQPAPVLPPYQNRFEHGMMVPAVIHAVQSYLMLIKAITPEYRSTGDFAYEIRKFAVKLETLTNTMRAETLARTLHPIAPQPSFVDKFLVTLYPEEVIDFDPSPFSNLRYISPTCSRFPVGALDLCVHTDAFFWQQRQAAIAAGHADPVYGPSVMGTMNSRWIPPARLERIVESRDDNTPPYIQPSPSVTYRITNPEECAAAANAQSEVDCANLLLASGYLNMVQMTTLMRHLATEPDCSETVKGDVILLRKLEATRNVSVKSRDIPFTGVIESSARCEPARCRAVIPISTQPLREDRMLPYRVVLRTLRSFLPPDHWVGPDYGEYYSTSYVKDLAPDRAGFFKLVTETKDPWVLSSYELVSGTSPRERIQHSGKVPLTAHTFDWYVPMASSFLDDDHLGDTLAALRSAGWSAPRRSPIPYRTISGNLLRSSTLTSADGLEIVGSYIWRDGTQDWEGQRREIKETEVRIKYTLDWKADRLHISLESRPEDRNYIVYLVVEETLPVSGQVLHTALPVPMNGELIYVPQEFLDDEQAAIDKANRIILDVATHYAESGPVGPEDPFIGRANPDDLISTGGLQRLADLAHQYQPALLQQAVQRYEVSTG